MQVLLGAHEQKVKDMPWSPTTTSITSTTSTASSNARIWRETIEGSRTCEGTNCQSWSHGGSSKVWCQRLVKDKASLDDLYTNLSHVRALFSVSFFLTRILGWSFLWGANVWVAKGDSHSRVWVVIGHILLYSTIGSCTSTQNRIAKGLLYNIGVLSYV